MSARLKVEIPASARDKKSPIVSTATDSKSVMRYLPRLAGILSAFVLLELVLHTVSPDSFLRHGQLPLGARLFVLAYTVVALTAFFFAIGGVLTLLSQLWCRVFLSWVRHEWLARFALLLTIFLIFLLYVSSWAAFWQIGKFLDRHALSFWVAQPLQVFHWVDADVVIGVLVITLAVVLLLGHGLPRWIETWRPDRQRALVQTFGAAVSFCLFWALLGELYGIRGEQRYLQSQIFYRRSRDEISSPFAHLLADFRRSTGETPDELNVNRSIQTIRRPVISMEQYLASIDRRKVKPWNVIVLMVESLRSDQLRAYGSRRDIMPAVDALAQEGRVFLNTHAQASHTNYAVSTPLSSHYPLRSATEYTYYPNNPTYPRVFIYDVLKALGYHTAIFSSSNENWLGMINYLQTGNIDQLFHAPTFKGPTYVMPGDMGFANWVRETKSAGSVDDRFTIGEAIKWIDQLNEEPFFLYINFQNSHLPYRVPEDFQRPFGPKELNFTIRFGYFPKDKVDTVKDVYADSLAYVDAQIARIFEHLRRRGMWDRTIVIFTGDHGQAFYEHGFSAHGGEIFDEVMKVPLIIRAQGLQAGVDTGPAQHIDVPPSVLDLLGLPPHPSFQGTTLFGPGLRPDRSKYMVAQTFLAYEYGIIRSGWKLIYNEFKQSYLLYNLAVDPEEQTNLAQEKPQLVKDLAKRLHTWRTLQIDYYANRDLHSREYPPILKD